MRTCRYACDSFTFTNWVCSFIICSERDANVMPIFFCDKTAQRATPEVSIKTIVGQFPLKWANSLLDAICLFGSSNAYRHSSFKCILHLSWTLPMWYWNLCKIWKKRHMMFCILRTEWTPLTFLRVQAWTVLHHWTLMDEHHSWRSDLKLTRQNQHQMNTWMHFFGIVFNEFLYAHFKVLLMISKANSCDDDGIKQIPIAWTSLIDFPNDFLDCTSSWTTSNWQTCPLISAIWIYLYSQRPTLLCKFNSKITAFRVHLGEDGWSREEFV